MLDLPPQVFNAWTCDHLWFLAELCSDILECSAPPPPLPVTPTDPTCSCALTWSRVGGGG